jgi:hypothetical protein
VTDEQRATLSGLHWQAVADLYAKAVRMRAEADQIEEWTGEETLASAWLRFGAAWVDLAAAVLRCGR